ncbi:MAG TPA: DUF3180 domain-containing protein [Jatrophihabitans sp.]
MTGPQMRRTGPLDLIIPFGIIGVTAYVLLRTSYSALPPLGYFVPVPLAVLGIIELVVARRVRLAVRHVAFAKPMTAIAIARCVALGKASSVVGAAVAGATVALLARVLPDAGDVRAAANDARVGLFLLASTILVTVAGIVLERAGIDPNSERSDRDDRRN